MTPFISVLHATRGRPTMAVQAMRWYRDRASGKHPIEYIFSFDDDDATRAFCHQELVAESPTPWFEVRTVSGSPPANNPAWNRAWRISSGKLLFESSDDFEPPQLWDTAIIGAAGGEAALDNPMVVGVSDIHGGWEAPLTGDGACEYYICTRAYTERAGYFLYPEYLTFGVFDIDQKAIFDDCFVSAHHVRFLHHWHGGEGDPLRDDTYRRRHLYEDPKYARDIHHRLDEDRCWCGYLDVRLDGDPRRPFFPEAEFLGPPCLSMEEKLQIFERRAAGPCPELRNVMPVNPEDPRHAYHRGDYRTALDGFLRLRDRYAPMCDGRMRHHGLKHVISVCEGQIK